MDRESTRPVPETPPSESGQLRQRKGKMVPQISPAHSPAEPAFGGGATTAGSSLIHSQSEMRHLPDSHSVTEGHKIPDDSGRNQTPPYDRVSSSVYLDGSNGSRLSPTASRTAPKHHWLKSDGKTLKKASRKNLSGYEETDLGELTQPLLQDEMVDSEEVELQSTSEIDRDEEEGAEIDKKEAEIKAAENEPSWSIAIQVFIPFLIAGLGMVGAGVVLDIVQHWDVFINVSEVFILVPALLGLKGNLEMTLASRLSTQANIGNMDSREEQWKMIAGNMALTQAQAIVVGFFASCAAMVFGWIPQGKFNLQHGLLLCASSVLTAAIASFVLGGIMVLVVLLSRRFRINPDNVATPIAASLGDLTTLSLLAGISHGLYNAIDKQVWVAPVLLSIFLLLVPVWCYVSLRNHYVADVIYTGWTPVICAMVISSIGGLILDFTVSTFTGIAVFQPVINGVGGNLVAVQASRLSTALHRLSTPGVLPEGHKGGCSNPFQIFFGPGLEPRTVRVLLLLVVPGHLIFMYTISYMQAGHTSITLPFALIYLSAAVIQVALLLYIGSWMVHYIWRKGDDPDNCAIPYLTALGDLLGTGLLAIAFQILYMIGDRDKDVGD